MTALDSSVVAAQPPIPNVNSTARMIPSSK
jgi:hypothetical protein